MAENLVESKSLYNPIRLVSGIPIPKYRPNSQSIFYMPVIAEAFYIALRKKVPQSILNESDKLLGLTNRDTNKQLISINQYNLIVESIVEYLKQNCNLNILIQQFKDDLYPHTNSGHINGSNQEKLLESVIIHGIQMFGGPVNVQLFLENAIGAHYGM